MSRRVFEKSIVAALIVGCFLTPASDAKKSSKKKSLLPDCYSGFCNPSSRADEVFDPTAQMLVGKLSHDPSLMNVEYLKYYIGRPHNEKHQRSGLRPHYVWYDEHNTPKFELEQTQQSPGEVVESQMTVRLDGMGVSFDKLAALYGPPIKRFYDYRAQPAEIYSFAPNTYVCFTQPPNTFRCSEAKIVYRGTPLPQPPAAEMTLGEAALVARGAALDQEEITSGSIPILQARVKTRPMDAESHLALANAYRMQSQLHPAIAEYKVALALSGSNGDVRAKAIDALRGMRVIDDYDPTDKRMLEMVHRGQALKATGRKNKMTDDQINATSAAAPKQL